MRVVGMISGTSFDAIEAVAADFALEGDTVVATFLGHISSPYPSEVRAAIAAAMPPAPTTMEMVCQLDTAIGQTFAEVAERIIREHCSGHADVVSSHGQTLYHWVSEGRALGTLQLGQPAWIAERTGATVVSDLRSRDIAAGGHGAPLASLLDFMLLGGGSTPRGALNLGGISNLTVLPPGGDPLAFDIGPGNALLDAAVAWQSGGSADHDHDGKGAGRGSVDKDLLAELLDDAYYRLAPPKSTGKEHFHLQYLQSHLHARQISGDDLLATLARLTIELVASEVRHYALEEVVVSGGGTRNPVLMQGLKALLPGVAVATIDRFGVPEAAKEALMFALIGFLSIHGLPASIPSCTGARHPSVLGSITPGRQPLLSGDRGLPPNRLVMQPQRSNDP